MATGTSSTGKTVAAGDQLTIVGVVTSISGTGFNATVTVKDRSGNTFTVKGSDCSAPQTEGPALSRDGKKFSVGYEVTIPAVAQSVSGSGATASVVSKVTSGSTVTHSAGTANAPHNH